MKDKRYISGSSLERTNKETDLDTLEDLLNVNLNDQLYNDMKKLSRTTIKELNKLIRESRGK